MNLQIDKLAEGLPRRGFTTADVVRMVEAGLIDPKERIELIGGALVMMSPKGIRHERLKMVLNEWLIRNLPERFQVIPETTFHLAEDTYLEPDFALFSRDTDLADLNGATALLVIEVADSSLSYDKGQKAKVMAAFGVREYWVIDANHLVTTVHRSPSTDGYEDVVEHPGETALAPSLVDGFALKVADLNL